MKVLNVHKRIINQSASEIGKLLSTLATDNDLMLATDKWPRMKLDKGLQVGSKGGHGPIKYQVIKYNPNKSITFQFDMKGFHGYHIFKIIKLESNKTELRHAILMNTSGMMIIGWALVIRWLHDAFIEDAFDKVENHFTNEKKKSKWNLWVRILRSVLKSRKS